MPDKVPAEQFWAVRLYDYETCSFIRDVNRLGLDSYDQQMHCKRRFGGHLLRTAAAHRPGCQLDPTMPGRGYFPWFRF